MPSKASTNHNKRKIMSTDLTIYLWNILFMWNFRSVRNIRSIPKRLRPSEQTPTKRPIAKSTTKRPRLPLLLRTFFDSHENQSYQTLNICHFQKKSIYQTNKLFGITEPNRIKKCQNGTKACQGEKIGQFFIWMCVCVSKTAWRDFQRASYTPNGHLNKTKPTKYELRMHVRAGKMAV